MIHTGMRFCISGSFFNSSHRHGNQNKNELGTISQETKETEKATQNLPTNLVAILLPGVLLDSVNPLLCMWGGAVNRQPGYRARNLQRRGLLAFA